jgi:hypothetical protein
MQKVELTSKLVLALIAIIVVSSVMTVVPMNASALTIPNGFITSGMIKDGNVRTQDLADNAVTSPKIADGTIQEQDIADGVIPDGGGVQPTVHEVRAIGTVAAHGVGRADAICPDGEIVTGGGFSSPLTNGVALNFFGSAPESDRNAWVVVAQNPGDVDGQFNAVAACMDFSP